MSGGATNHNLSHNTRESVEDERKAGRAPIFFPKGREGG